MSIMLNAIQCGLYYVDMKLYELSFLFPYNKTTLYVLLSADESSSSKADTRSAGELSG
jgi:hypothetical protein